MGLCEVVMKGGLKFRAHMGLIYSRSKTLARKKLS